MPILINPGPKTRTVTHRHTSGTNNTPGPKRRPQCAHHSDQSVDPKIAPGVPLAPRGRGLIENGSWKNNSSALQGIPDNALGKRGIVFIELGGCQCSAVAEPGEPHA